MLEARSLTFGYDSSRLLFDRWSASFAAGDVTAITGASGKGKSTLLYLLGLLLKPTGGNVLVGGRALSTLGDAQRARHRAHSFGFVFQDASLDPRRTVMDNVVEGGLYRFDDRRHARSRAHALLERFGVDVRAEARPGQVSGGQAQRIALCRALLHSPSVILADEPTGNLDTGTAKLVTDALHEQAREGAAVVIVTHDLAIAAQCHRRVDLR